MEVADDRHAHALLVQFLNNARHRRGSLVIVNCDAHQFRSGASQSSHLLHGPGNICRVGVRHGLHHNRCIRPDPHTSNHGGHSLSALNHSHWELLVYHAEKPGFTIPA